jgi:hypothetical protein
MAFPVPQVGGWYAYNCLFLNIVVYDITLEIKHIFSNVPTINVKEILGADMVLAD